MPRASSTRQPVTQRGKSFGYIPEVFAHWSGPELLEDGFAIDVWAERSVQAEDAAELQAAARLLNCPTLMVAPASVRGIVTLDSSRLVVSVFMVGSGAYGPAMGSIAECGLQDLWHAVHLASRPEAAHLRSADQVLSLARIRRAMA